MVAVRVPLTSVPRIRVPEPPLMLTLWAEPPMLAVAASPLTDRRKVSPWRVRIAVPVRTAEPTVMLAVACTDSPATPS